MNGVNHRPTSPPDGPPTTWSTACAAFCSNAPSAISAHSTPSPTGVLPLVTGSLTRLAQFYISSEKTYEGVIRFGFATNTYGRRWRTLTNKCRDKRISCRGSRPRLSIGPQARSRPRFSPNSRRPIPRPHPAKSLHHSPPRKSGRPRLQTGAQTARGRPPARRSRSQRIVITAVHADRAPFRARVSSGTYMRSIAHEMGPAPRLRSPSRIAPPHLRRRIRHHPSPHPRGD